MGGVIFKSSINWKWSALGTWNLQPEIAARGVLQFGMISHLKTAMKSENGALQIGQTVCSSTWYACWDFTLSRAWYHIWCEYGDLWSKFRNYGTSFGAHSMEVDVMEGFKLCVTTKLGNHAYTLELSAKTLIHHQLHGDHERTAGASQSSPRRGWDCRFECRKVLLSMVGVQGNCLIATSPTITPPSL